MKAQPFFLIILFLTFNTLLSFGQEKQDYRLLFEKGKYAMETKGDLKEAINIFESLIKTFPEEKEYCANSQLMIGMCYEKLGNNEASRAYQLVLDKYPDQKEAVTLARQKLSRLISDKPVSKPEGMMVRKIMDVPKGQTVNTFSRDGRYVIMGDQSSVTLLVKDFNTGEIWPVSEKGSYEGTPKSPDVCIISPDNKQVAYWWWEGTSLDITELRIVNLDGTGKRTIAHNERSSDTTTCPIPVRWSPDGKYIMGALVVFEKEGVPITKGHLVLVSVEDGSFKKILTASADRQINYPSLSPDGKFIVFDLVQSAGTRNKDIHIMEMGNQLESPLIEHPANDWAPFYSRDGKYIVFVSDRFGSNGLFMQDMSAGKPADAPRLLKSNLDEGFEPWVLTTDGSLIYITGAFQMDIYTAALNQEDTVSIGSSLKLPARFEGINIKPAYSPDGKYLAYHSLREKSYFQEMIYVIRDLSTGEEFDLATNLFTGTAMYWNSTQWSPDSRYLLVHAKPDNYSEQDGFFRIDIKTGQSEMIIGEVKPMDPRFGLFPQFTPDGKSLVYLSNDRMSIIRHELSNNKESVIYQSDQKMGYISISRKGNYIAVGQALNVRDELNGLLLVPVEDGQPVKFNNPAEKGILRWPEWTPDDKGVIAPVYESGDLYLFPVDGSQPVKLNFKNKDLGYIRIHPDGKQVVYDQLIKRNKEIWAIDNFIPVK